MRSIDSSLKKLDVDYIDLLLIHEPTGDVHEIYRAMETAYKNGKLQAIGVSNFLEERYLDLINHCKVIPAINQVETHVFRQQAQLRKLECQIGTKHESWSPLACGQNGIWQTPTLIEIARNHGKSVSQIALQINFARFASQTRNNNEQGRKEDFIMKKTIFVLGAGNGCGNRVAEKFGKNDFRVVLMAKNSEHLAAYEKEFKDKGIEVYTKVADASKPYSVTKAFDELKAQFGIPDVLFYNVGITTGRRNQRSERH